jgi:ABC-type antimicrobial peptide transport system permease subunit
MSTLWHFRLTNLAVMCAVAVGTAVLTGSLLVGDSVRNSLTVMVERRLGSVDHVLLTPQFFEESLAERLSKHPSFSANFTAVEPALTTSGNCTEPDSGSIATRVNVFGRSSIEPGTCVLSRKLAEQLNVNAGGIVVLHTDMLRSVPAGLPVSAEKGKVAILRLRVSRIAEEGGFEDAFSFYGSQRPVKDVWCSLAELQKALDVPGSANVLFVSAGDGYKDNKGASRLQDLLARAVSLEDLGLRFSLAKPNEFTLSSQQILISHAVERAVEEAFPESIKVFPYVIDTISDPATKREIPYSIVAGISRLPDGVIARDRIVLNKWAADDLNAKPGDLLTLSFVSRPESGLPEKHSVQLVLDHVIETAGIGADSTLVPEFKGVTDAGSLAAWKPPRDFDFRPERIREMDETYWKRFRAAPKGFINIGTAQKLWGLDYGALTSFRFLDVDEASLRMDILRAIPPAAAGLVWRPIRSQQLSATAGNTDFTRLFTAFSFFIVISSVLLILLTMSLAVEQRSHQIGVMSALGFTRRLIMGLFLAEGFLIVVAGCVLGTAGAVGYAWLMLAGLKTIWNSALGTTQIAISSGVNTLLTGALLGGAIGFLAIWRSITRIQQISVIEALSGKRNTPSIAASRKHRASFTIAIVSATMAILFLAAPFLHLISTTIAFFAAGALLLITFLAALSSWLNSASLPHGTTPARMGIAALSARNAARNPARSMLTAGLLASATFITVAVNSMKETPSAESGRASGTGGFSLVAEFDVPIPYDLNSVKARDFLALGAENDIWREVHFISMKTSPGEDTSCRNLLRPSNPKLCAVPETLIKEQPFTFVSSIASPANPWKLLDAELPGGAIPAIADYQTARWILQKNLGDSVAVTDENGTVRTLNIVALLRNSIFQSELLVSGRNFSTLFPSQTGYRLLLVTAPPDSTTKVSSLLSKQLADFGVTVEPAEERLASFSRVANTYISAFSALGDLGILLGSLGLLVVLIRGIIERRNEIALLWALGFGHGPIAFIVSFENVFLLLWGLFAGALSALLAIAPEFAKSGVHAIPVMVTLALFCGIAALITSLLILIGLGMTRKVTPAALRLE